MIAVESPNGDGCLDELEREHEIRNLKETVEALREALEKQKAGTAGEVAEAVAEAHTEIRDLKSTISEMRMEIERRKATGEEAVQNVLAKAAEDGRQLQSSVQALRDQLEREKARHEEEAQLMRRVHRDENVRFLTVEWKAASRQ